MSEIEWELPIASQEPTIIRGHTRELPVWNLCVGLRRELKFNLYHLIMAYTSPNIVLDGVQEDLSTLVYSFVSSGEMNFRHFVKLWKDNHFPYLYSGRTVIKEVKYLAREILILAKKYCSVKNFIGERIAGVYLMYALYYAQPLKIPVRIRIDKYDFGDLLEFVKEATEKDVRICFYHLFIDQAFDFVYSEKLYSLERIRDRELEAKNRKGLIHRGHVSTKEQMETLWKNIDFNHKEWLEKESEYNKLKSSLNKLGLGPKFEMTEFLKPLLTVDELSSARQRPQKGKPSASSSDKKKRIRSAFRVLEEAPSSSDEEGLGGGGSMPHLDPNASSDEDVDPLAGDPIEII